MPMDEKEFRYKVERLRAAQKAYFSERTQSALIAAKQAEREVDAALREFDEREHAPAESQAAMDFDL